MNAIEKQLDLFDAPVQASLFVEQEAAPIEPRWRVEVVRQMFEMIEDIAADVCRDVSPNHDLDFRTTVVCGVLIHEECDWRVLDQVLIAKGHALLLAKEAEWLVKLRETTSRRTQAKHWYEAFDKTLAIYNEER